MQVTDLVVQAAITSVARQAFDHGEDHLDPGAPTGELQPPYVRNDSLVQRTEEIAVAILKLCLGEPGIFAPVCPHGIVLHVDDEQRSVQRVDLDFAAQAGAAHVPASRSRASAAGNSLANRAAQLACPAASAIRSWRISISTWGRPRRSAWIGTV